MSGRIGLAAAAIMLATATTGAAVAQVPADIQTSLRQMGRVIAPADTAKLYRPLFDANLLNGITAVRDVSFGADPKQMLNVYKPAASGAARPILIFFPGGQGVKQMAGPEGVPFYDNIGAWGVRNGMIVVVAQYRTGGGAAWDAGARDVASAIQWVKANARAHGGDPDRVVAMGQSNGGSQLSNYLGQPAIQGPNGPGLRGAVIMGSNTNLLPVQLKSPPPRLPAPAGPATGAPPAAPPPVDPAVMLQRSNLEGFKAQRIPIMLIASELDPEDRVEFVQVLGDELRKAGRTPTTTIVPGHSHISQILSFGTPDETMSRPVLQFIRGVV